MHTAVASVRVSSEFSFLIADICTCVILEIHRCIESVGDSLQLLAFTDAFYLHRVLRSRVTDDRIKPNRDKSNYISNFGHRFEINNLRTALSWPKRLAHPYEPWTIPTVHICMQILLLISERNDCNSLVIWKECQGFKKSPELPFKNEPP